jgi:hypothetical protein
MLVDLMARTTVSSRVSGSSPVERGLRDLQRLEYPREDLAWLGTEVQGIRRRRTPTVGGGPAVSAGPRQPVAGRDRRVSERAVEALGVDRSCYRP